MSYVDSQLLPGEHVAYRAHLHRILFLPTYVMVALTLLLAGIALLGNDLWVGAAILAVLSSALYAWESITYHTSEFAVTDRRVIIKVGWLKRRTLETMLAKVEALGVDQGLLGRLLDFGTITVTGTGGTRETFHQIAAPLEFRKHVQAQAMAADDRRATAAPVEARMPAAAPPPLEVTPREERECPFCAERILLRAKVCRFCGQDLTPISPG